MDQGLVIFGFLELGFSVFADSWPVPKFCDWDGGALGAGVEIAPQGLRCVHLLNVLPFSSASSIFSHKYEMILLFL